VTDTPPAPARRDVASSAERQTLEAFLDDYRDIVVRKASGLSETDARRRLVPSATTVGGLVKHLRWAEFGWFEQLLQEHLDDNRRPHDRAWEFELGDDEALPMLIDGYRRQCEQCRRIAARYPLDHTVAHRRLGRVSLRWIYVHMIEETARHCGQIDILREQLDGATGFD